MDDYQLCVGARNEYRGDLASGIPSHRTSGRRSRTFYPHLCQIGTILGALYAYIVSDARHFGGPSFIPTIMNVS